MRLGKPLGPNDCLGSRAEPAPGNHSPALSTPQQMPQEPQPSAAP